MVALYILLVVLAVAAAIIYVVARPDLKLVENWRHWHKMASMRLNLIASAVVAFFLAQPQLLVGVFGSLSEEQRIPFAIFCGAAMFALVAITRLTKKDKPDGDCASDE